MKTRSSAFSRFPRDPLPPSTVVFSEGLLPSRSSLSRPSERDTVKTCDYCVNTIVTRARAFTPRITRSKSTEQTTSFYAACLFFRCVLRQVPNFAYLSVSPYFFYFPESLFVKYICNIKAIRLCGVCVRVYALIKRERCSHFYAIRLNESSGFISSRNFSIILSLRLSCVHVFYSLRPGAHTFCTFRILCAARGS